MISFAPVTARLRRRLFGGELFDAAVERAELAPAAMIFSPAAIALPNESARATATMAHTTVDAIRSIEREGEYQHGATIAYRLKDAIIADGCIYSRGRYRVDKAASRRAVLRSAAAEWQEAQFSTDASSELYFGHWLCDGLSTELLAAQRKLSSLIYSDTIRSHEEGYRALLGVWSEPVSLARVIDLWVIDDRGVNQERRARFAELRQRLSAAVERPAQGDRHIFVHRGTGGKSRLLINELALEEELAGRGFDIVDPLRMSARDIARTFGQARLVVGVEGSHQSHALLAMPPGGAVITIQPPDRFLHSWKFFCDVAELRYGFVVADAAGHGFQLSTDRLLKTIDLVLSAI